MKNHHNKNTQNWRVHIQIRGKKLRKKLRINIHQEKKMKNQICGSDRRGREDPPDRRRRSRRRRGCAREMMQRDAFSHSSLPLWSREMTQSRGDAGKRYEAERGRVIRMWRWNRGEMKMEWYILFYFCIKGRWKRFWSDIFFWFGDLSISFGLKKGGMKEQMKVLEWNKYRDAFFFLSFFDGNGDAFFEAEMKCKIENE